MERSKSSGTPKNRLRVFQRVSVDGQVLIHDEEQLFIAPLNNISAGGLFVNDLVDLPRGRTVRVVVKSSKLKGPVQANGTIVRIQEGEHGRGIAIEFTSISSAAREAIQSCVYESRMGSALKVV